MFDIASWLGGGVKNSAGSLPGLTSGLVGKDDDETPLWQKLVGFGATIGTDIYKTKTAADIASKQIAAGQYPTAIGQGGNLAGTANVSPAIFNGNSILGGSTMTIVLIVGAVLLVVMMVGRR